MEFSVMVLFSAIMIYQILLMRHTEDRFSIVYHVCYYFYEFASVAMALITLLSARHIHNNSKQVEKLGIRTNSVIMKVYVVFWISLAVCTTSCFALININTVQIHLADCCDSDFFLRMMIAISTLISLLYVLIASLEIIMLYAYHRISERLSSKETKLLA